MGDVVVNVHAAKTGLSKLVARAERGERITIARAGKAVALLGPVPKRKSTPIPPEDPILHLDSFAIDGTGGALTNVDIDRLLYGQS